MTAVLEVETTPCGDGWQCSVEVTEGVDRTRHLVRLGRVDLERWGRPGEGPEGLVRRSFQFLLAREPAGQILRSFDLPVIQRYFPEFDREIRTP
jgi:hypothetical protein